MNNTHQNNDEISLIDLMKIFWQQRITILTTVLITLSISIAYLFYAQPLYESKAIIEIPNSIDLGQLNKPAFHNPDEKQLKIYTASDIYSIFTKNLQSEKLKEQFFNEVYLPYITQTTQIKSIEAAYSKFLKHLKIKQDIIKNKQDPNEAANYLINITSTSSQQSDTFLKTYINMAQTMSMSDLNKDWNEQLKGKVLTIKSEIAAIKELSKKYNADSLVTLHQALNEAKKEKIDHFNSNNTNNSHFESFMLGTRILKLRIKEIQQSELSLNLINKYRELEGNYKYYSSSIKTLNVIQFYQLDGEVHSPEVPVSPQKSLIILMGLMIGLFMGCIGTLFVNYVKDSKTFLKPVRSF